MRLSRLGVSVAASVRSSSPKDRAALPVERGDDATVVARVMTSTRPIMRTGPWDPRDGDPSAPGSVGGVAVVTRIRVRDDHPGALVRLVDGRLAVSGEVSVVGSRRAVAEQAHGRLRRAVHADEAAWWRAVIGECAA